MPLLAGAFIYVFLREENQIFESFLGISSEMYYFPLPDTPLSGFVKYNLPDGLWMLSLLLFLRFLWAKAGFNRDYYILLTIVILIPVLIELLQFWSYLPGTFDILDCLVFLGSGGLFIVWSKFRKRTIKTSNS